MVLFKIIDFFFNQGGDSPLVSIFFNTVKRQKVAPPLGEVHQRHFPIDFQQIHPYKYFKIHPMISCTIEN